MKKAVCVVIDKVKECGGSCFSAVPTPHIEVVHDHFYVSVDFFGKRKTMEVKNDTWFTTLLRGQKVEIEYTTPWWKFGGIKIKTMRKVT